MYELALRSCGCTVIVQCSDRETAAILMAAFGALIGPSYSAIGDPAVRYCINREAATGGFRIGGAAGGDVAAEDVGRLLFHLDKMLTVTLQYRRTDLWFLHAAAVARDGRAVVLAAPPGTGKSTLTLALLQRGFDYLSDELSPVDLPALTVHPYPHALCLKARPPAPCHLPPETLDTGGRLHIPVTALPGQTYRLPLPLAALVFIHRGPPTGGVYQRLTAASAAAHLMANALNSLAHEGDGLPAAARLAEQIPAFHLDSRDLRAACRAVDDIVSGSAATSGAASVS